jgi:putative hydrolase of the HAD superfamily
MIKAIMFDWGGVLAENTTEKIIKKISTTFDINQDKLYDIYIKNLPKYELGALNSNEFWNIICDKFNIPLQKVKKLIAIVPKITPVFKLSKKLKLSGYKVSILSTNHEDRINIIKDNFNLNFFDDILFSKDIGIMKPNKKIYQIAMKRIKCQPKECIFIDDHIENVNGAKIIGMEAIHFRDIEQLEKELVSFGIFIDKKS